MPNNAHASFIGLCVNALVPSTAKAKVIDESQIDTSKAMLLSKVEIKNLKFDKVFKYQLVSVLQGNDQGRMGMGDF